MTKNGTESATSTISKQAFRLNGKDTFLYSGEVHYFRIPKRYWAKHLQALVDAGCNAVSTYVPWSWHEFKEGTVDLTGRTHPERNLQGFLDLARSFNLFVTVKPGPYVMAETTDQGIPRWLTSTYPETLARDENGVPWGPEFVAVLHPLFQQKAARWLKLFAERIVVPRQNLKHGAVIMMQLCNEIGIFQWLGAKGDYSPSTAQAWQAYLKERFSDLSQLAALLDRELKDYSDVRPPSEVCETRRQFVEYRLWHDFHRHLYARYVSYIVDTLRGAGVRTPLFTNVGGWVFGRAHEFALNGTFHRETAKANPEVIFGLDHIPEFVSPANAHDGFVANQVARELQRGGGPLYSAELQCGSREHGVQPYPGELGLFWRHCIIHGLTGMNFYMFSQGRNPKGRGTDGPMFYWFNAVDYKGDRQPVFPTIRDLGDWLKNNGDFLTEAQRPARLGLGFYPPLYETEFLVPILGKGTKLNSSKIGLAVNPVEFRDRAYFDGVIRILMKKSVPFDLADLTTRSIRELRSYQELVVVCNELMDAATQQRLSDYVKAGGKLVLFPMLPKYDLDFRPCTILADSLGIQTGERSASNRIYMDSLKDIPVPLPPQFVSSRGAKTLARDVDGHVVGIEKQAGKGVVRFFGFFVHYTIEEHPDLWSAMMQLPDIRRHVVADSDNLLVEARFHKGEGVVFVGNFHRMPMSANVRVNNPRGSGLLDLGRIELPSQYGLMLPVQKTLSSDAVLVFAHAELMNEKADRRAIRLTLQGADGQPGCLVLKTTRKVEAVSVDGQSVSFTRTGNVYRVEYAQNGQRQDISFV